ncbi:MAG: SMC family ATPase [Oscillospiraceae bacterium]|nr:SMC family ATPase [Oscillospiraceae bacterium]
MRPHKLTLNAFGMFANETVIPFDEMGNEVYLIAGATGSGKTTIFDALVYALFGTASGSGRSGLNTESFYSDFFYKEDSRPDLNVELEFSNAGHRYTVHRSMRWGKSGKASKAEKTSWLEENGTLIATGRGEETKDDVSKRIQSILGLNADQFRRIIMLAQGEFQKFLQAGSDVRGEILGKLYKNERQQDLEARLKAADNKLKEKEESLSTAIRQRLNQLVLTEELPEETRAMLLPDHVELTAAIGTILARQQEAHSGLLQEMQDGNELLMQMRATYTSGEKQNQMLDRLKRQQELLQDLEDRKPAVEQLRTELHKAESAERVLPDETAMYTAQTALNSTRNEIAGTENDLAKAGTQQAALQNAKDQIHGELDPVNIRLEGEIKLLQSIMPQYDALEAAQIRLQQTSRLQIEAESNYKTASDTQKSRSERLEKLDEQLRALTDAGETAINLAEKESEELQNRETKLTQLKADIRGILESEAKVKSLQQKQQALQISFNDAAAEHLRLHTAFLNGQAGLLAKELADQLQQSETAACPVCGVVHTKADVHGFAVYTDNIPSKAEVDAAFNALNRAKDLAEEQGKKLAAAESALAAGRKAVLSIASDLLETEQWDAISDFALVNAAIALCKEKHLQADAKLEQEIERYNKKEAALSSRADLEREQKEAETVLESLRTTMEQAKNDDTAAQTGVAKITELLKDYPASRSLADERIGSCRAQIKQNNTAIGAADSALSDCDNYIAALSGQLDTLNRNFKEQQAAAAEAERTYSASIRSHGFADEASYHVALAPEGTVLDKLALRRWIENAESSLESFDKQYQDTLATIQTLQETAEGMQYTDLQQLEEQIRRLDAHITALDVQEHTFDNALKTNRKIQEDIQGSLAEREKILKVRRHVQPMAMAANGNLPFSRYVLRDFYSNIVEQANVHLHTMTDGEYALRAVETGDKRRALGLNLTVENVTTGVERDTNSLSGGQKFEASLSLALGLSEIAQMQSTAAIQIDSIFIDEGFGSLDGVRLEKAIKVLNDISANRKQIGIISHVARLDDTLNKKLLVKQGEKGSSVSVVSDT